MKTTRPVFESFDAFVDFLKHDSLNEGEVTDWKGILNSLSGFFDDDAKKAFQGARNSYDKAPTYQRFKKESGTVLKGLLTAFDGAISSNIEDNQDSKKMQMAESTTTEIKTINYPGLINGKVKIAVASDYAAGDKAGISLSDTMWVDINDFISRINLSNLTYAKTDPNAENLDKKYGEWYPNPNDKDIVYASGPYLQDYISSIAGGISIGDFGDGRDPKKILPALSFAAFKPNKLSENPIKNTVILYGLGNVTQGGGDEIPDTLIKKEMTTEIVTGTVKEYETSITGDDKMFDQGKINIKNKAGIDKAISAALSPLAGSPESIVITGGASFEGGLELNKKLVVERAKAVQVYMEGLYPALKGKITVAETDFSKIQTKDVPAEYEQYRKVYLKIKGVLQGDSYTIDKEITYTVDAPILADSVEIIQYAVSFEYSIPNFKKK